MCSAIPAKIPACHWELWLGLARTVYIIFIYIPYATVCMVNSLPKLPYRTKSISPPPNFCFSWGRRLSGGLIYIYIFLKGVVVGRQRKLTFLSSASNEWSGSLPSTPWPPSSSSACLCPCKPRPSLACTCCTCRKVPARGGRLQHNSVITVINTVITVITTVTTVITVINSVITVINAIDTVITVINTVN